jgi:hypothetical protein
LKRNFAYSEWESYSGWNISKHTKKTITVNLEGKSIYPSFIDMYTSFGMDKPKKTEGSRQSQSYDTKREGYYWNEHIRSEVNAYDNFNYDQPKAEELLKAGFGVRHACSRRYRRAVPVH